MPGLPPVNEKLDLALGLSLQSADDDVVVMRLDPGEIGIVGEGDEAYLHGGALASCIDSAAWYAAEGAAPSEPSEGRGDWLVTTLSFEGLRLARPEPHTVTARCVRAGRTRAVADVEIAPEADPDRLVTIGRVSLARAPSPPRA
ncbi:MAG: PaaI family thioesterase [Actinobacteria bacterium]|nr:PaaI family thioesterase [Actinomycetota bacterium]